MKDKIISCHIIENQFSEPIADLRITNRKANYQHNFREILIPYPNKIEILHDRLLTIQD